MNHARKDGVGKPRNLIKGFKNATPAKNTHTHEHTDTQTHTFSRLTFNLQHVDHLVFVIDAHIAVLKPDHSGLSKANGVNSKP